MTVVAWILTALLALVFLAAGLMKLARPREALASAGMGWAGDFAASHVKLIGAVEVLGALGLVLPLLTGTAEVLAPIAAVALAVLMIGAVVVHVRRGEPFVPPLVLALLAVVAAVLDLLVLV